MPVSSISGQDVMPAGSLQSMAQYAQDASSQDITTETRSSYQPASDPSLGSNIDVSA